MANRSATSALIRAGSLTAKEIPAERVHTHGVCGRHGETEKRLTWGGLVGFPMRVFMPPGGGRRAGGEGRAIKPRLKCSTDAQREVRGLIRARTRCESGATRAMAARGMWLGESRPTWCKGGPQEWEPERAAVLSPDPEAR